ncbi:hypothetical protein JX266_001342 [Neoarthrinium moseri]|nr:hypothetical protein JX266_001342 [Neoarthrinium moseri]
MAELDPLVLSYSHLKDLPRAKDALQTLQKIASLVKPIMRARGWKVRQLTEFYPSEQNLLGLNVNRGQKICLRLRYPSDRNQFLPIEQVVDTMLHELSHIVHGPHNAKFHALWDQLRDEHEALLMKGYTGEGFLSEGQRLGGRGGVPMHEARRLARAAAEKRRTLAAGSGQRLGGRAPRPGQDIRKVIVDAVERRNKTLQGCASTTHNEAEIQEIADTATRNGFSTKAEEDAANEAAIAQALWELVQEDEKAKHGASYAPPTSGNPAGSASQGLQVSRADHMKDKPSAQLGNKREGLPEVDKNDPASTSWTCHVCTLENPLEYLCCDACGTERAEEVTKDLAERGVKRQRIATIDLTTNSPNGTRSVPSAGKFNSNSATSALGAKPVAPRTWTCSVCGRLRDWNFWSCDLCGKIKETS